MITQSSQARTCERPCGAFGYEHYRIYIFSDSWGKNDIQYSRDASLREARETIRKISFIRDDCSCNFVGANHRVVVVHNGANQRQAKRSPSAFAG